MRKTKQMSGFTIVELLIVVVVIAILAAITIVSYNGISNRAQESGMKTELRQAVNKLGIYVAEKSNYPPTLEDAGVKSSTQNQLSYQSDGSTFCVDIRNTKISKTYRQMQSGVIEEGVCAVPGTAAECFEFDSSTGTITSYSSDINSTLCPRDVKIPASINGTAVKTIGVFSFAMKNLTAVTIPNSVTSLENEAFFSNQITTVTIPNSVTSISQYAFYENQLTSVSIPDSITYIPDYTFTSNQLTSVSVGSSTVVGPEAFDLGVTVNRR